MTDQENVRKISTLMRMEEATREAYDVALGKLGNNKVAPSMHRFREHHKQHAEDLRQVVGQMGTTPAGSTEADKYYDTLIDSVRQARGYDGVFSTLRVAEAAVKVQYEDAMQMQVSDQAMQTIRQCAKDEIEHVNVLEIATHGLAQV